MTPLEFTTLRETLGLTQAQLTRVWNLDYNAGRQRIRRWELGETPIDPIAAYALTLMAETQKTSADTR